MRGRLTAVVLGGALLFAAGLSGGRLLGVGEDPGGFLPSAWSDEGEQLSMVFIFSSSCAACLDPEVPDLVEAAKERLHVEADRRGLGFHAMAASTDPIPEMGYDYLEGHGRFDEVSLGGGWRNNALIRYVWDDHAGPPEVPQVVLIRRDLIGPDNGFYGVESQELLGRVVGLGELRRWVYEGVPIRHPAWE